MSGCRWILNAVSHTSEQYIRECDFATFIDSLLALTQTLNFWSSLLSEAIRL